MTGHVYLIHFEEKLAHAQHYIGFSNDVEARHARHSRCDGARILRACKMAGIGFEVVRTWVGDRNMERRLKNQRNAKRMCPVCQKEKEK